ncbi:Hypothetical predicted protein [Octopus vulgaris]|uniref:Uncharacterized protein n=1 Tax=Octopus vulgaris TaxID=6645 RepID=A0AA36B2M7_OCTVU|nr:Hypothetical predicted protein [Octopus vulgaris]
MDATLIVRLITWIGKWVVKRGGVISVPILYPIISLVAVSGCLLLVVVCVGLYVFMVAVIAIPIIIVILIVVIVVVGLVPGGFLIVCADIVIRVAVVFVTPASGGGVIAGSSVELLALVVAFDVVTAVFVVAELIGIPIVVLIIVAVVVISG